MEDAGGGWFHRRRRHGSAAFGAAALRMPRTTQIMARSSTGRRGARAGERADLFFPRRLEPKRHQAFGQARSAL
eukprot:10399496-Alexandrium_andersonii.AAC.1